MASRGTAGTPGQGTPGQTGRDRQGMLTGLLVHHHTQLPPAHAAADQLVHKQLGEQLGRRPALGAGRVARRGGSSSGGRLLGHGFEVDRIGQLGKALHGCRGRGQQGRVPGAVALSAAVRGLAQGGASQALCSHHGSSAED